MNLRIPIRKLIVHQKCCYGGHEENPLLCKPLLYYMSKLKLFLKYSLTPILSLSKVSVNKLSYSVLNKANTNVNLKTLLSNVLYPAKLP